MSVCLCVCLSVFFYSSFQGYGTDSEIQGSATEALGLLGVGDSSSSLVHFLIHMSSASRLISS